MGLCLHDRKSNDIVLDVNFWHYRAIVEAIRSLQVLPEATVDALHESWQGTGLTAEAARLVAAAIRDRLLPTLADNERLLLDGTRTTEPDDGTMHYGPTDSQKNYSTNRRVLQAFAVCCESCDGFSVC